MTGIPIDVAPDFKARHHITADDFKDSSGNYDERNAGIDWRKLLITYFEDRAIVPWHLVPRVVDANLAKIRHDVFMLSMKAAAIELQRMALEACQQADVRHDDLQVRFIDGKRHYDTMPGEMGAVLYELATSILTEQQKKILLAYYGPEIPEDDPDPLLACVACLVDDTLTRTSEPFNIDHLVIC